MLGRAIRRVNVSSAGLVRMLVCEESVILVMRYPAQM